MILTPSAKYFWSQTFHFCYRNYLASLQHFEYWKFLVTPPHLWPVWSYAYSPRRYSSVWHSSFEPSVASLLPTLSYSPLLPTQPCRCFPMITSSISLHSPPQTPVPLAPDDESLHHVLGTVLPQKKIWWCSTLFLSTCQVTTAFWIVWLVGWARTTEETNSPGTLELPVWFCLECCMSEAWTSTYLRVTTADWVCKPLWE